MVRTDVGWPGWSIVKPIGQGGFGTVYEISREILGDVERAALKVISVPHSSDEVDYLRCGGLDEETIRQTVHKQMEDIAREYKLMSKMRECVNVVHCDDLLIKEHEDGLGWDLLIKMELLTPLMKALDKVSTQEQVVRLGKDLCRALIACQKRNVIHRDIKPQNVFLSEEGNFKLGDFGIARTMERTTRATAGIGTFSFIAPEVVRNEPYGKTADIYSLGLLLHWLLNERRSPFMPLPPMVPKHGEEEQARQRRLSGEPLPPPANGSAELKAVVMKACAYRPEARYQSAEEMLQALERVSGQTQQYAGYLRPELEPDGERTAMAWQSAQPRRQAPTAPVRQQAAGVGMNTERTQTSGSEETVGQPWMGTPSGWTPKQLEKPKKKRKLWPVFTAVAMVVVLLLGGMGVWLLRQPPQQPVILSDGDVAGGAASSDVVDEAIGENELPADIEEEKPEVEKIVEEPEKVRGTASAIKIGAILVHDENSGYDMAHIEGLNAACEALGIPMENVIYKYNIPEDKTCYDAAADLADSGCDIIFSDSYGHQTYMAQAAEEFPETIFVACAGDQAATSGLSNLKNIFPYTYESRYVSGVVAGMKLAEMLKSGEATDAYVGYIGAFPYAEVVSGYTAFFLGIQSVVPEAHMDVLYTNSWYDPSAESEAANALMRRGCVIIGQHADSTGAPAAVQAAWEAGSKVYSVGYNIDMLAVAPDAALTSAQNVWSALYQATLETFVAGEEVPTDYACGIADGAQQISALGPNVAEGTREAVAAAWAGIADGSIKVFDTSKFTVGGETVTTAFALDSDGDFVNDYEEAIVDGAFAESVLRSAPYFSLRIDGITELN